MSSDGADPVHVRFWASARAAAGTPECDVSVPGEVDLRWLESRLVEQLGGAPEARAGRLEQVLDVCSVLVGDRPAGAADRHAVQVRPGDVVEFLPPFAGG